ncbi:unnamed protein product, partial [Larinioides sclopetarius]
VTVTSRRRKWAEPLSRGVRLPCFNRSCFFGESGVSLSLQNLARRRAAKKILITKVMASAVDKEGVRDAYQDVRSDTSGTNWALFRYKGAEIVHDCSGENLQELKDALSDDERAFAFVRVFAGDEMSKRKKFVLLTWVGPSVSTLKRARVSIDKALVKQVVQNFAVELQIESPDELSDDFLRSAVDRVGGANYGTGTRT